MTAMASCTGAHTRKHTKITEIYFHEDAKNPPGGCGGGCGMAAATVVIGATGGAAPGPVASAASAAGVVAASAAGVVAASAAGVVAASAAGVVAVSAAGVVAAFAAGVSAAPSSMAASSSVSSSMGCRWSSSKLAICWAPIILLCSASDCKAWVMTPTKGVMSNDSGACVGLGIGMRGATRTPLLAPVRTTAGGGGGGGGKGGNGTQGLMLEPAPNNVTSGSDHEWRPGPPLFGVEACHSGSCC